MANLESLKFGLCSICKLTHCITDLTKQIFILSLCFRKLLASTFSCGVVGMKTLFLRLLLLPIAMSILWAFYANVGVSNLSDFQQVIIKDSLLVRMMPADFSPKMA